MRKNDKKDKELYRLCRVMAKDSVRISVPRAFLPMLTLFFHHASDAMGGDDRPDHGLAMIRKGREHYRGPFYFLYGKLRRAFKKMDRAHERKAAQLFYRYHELSADETRRIPSKRA